MFTLGLMNIHQLISIPRTIWTWVSCLIPMPLLTISTRVKLPKNTKNPTHYILLLIAWKIQLYLTCMQVALQSAILYWTCRTSWPLSGRSFLSLLICLYSNSISILTDAQLLYGAARRWISLDMIPIVADVPGAMLKPSSDGFGVESVCKSKISHLCNGPDMMFSWRESCTESFTPKKPHHYFLYKMASPLFWCFFLWMNLCLWKCHVWSIAHLHYQFSFPIHVLQPQWGWSMKIQMKV